MAVQLKLVRREDAVGDATSISLLSNTDGFDLAANGWEEAVASEEGVPVTEVLRLRGKGSSHDNLASKMQGLIQKLYKESGDYHKRPLEPYSVWLRAQLTNETNARQALVKGVTIGKLALHTYPALNSSAVPEIQVAIDRMHWEEISASSITANNMNSLGGMSSDYGAIAGDMVARISAIDFSAGTSDVTDPVTEVWLGVKSDRYGVTPTNFKSVWNLRLASTLSNNTATGVDASAQDGNKIVVTIGSSPTLLQRALIQVSDVTSNYADQQGRYMVLLRAKTTSTAVCRARIASGVFAGSSFKFNGRVPISDTDWKLYPMGSISIPDIGRFSAGIGSFWRSCAVRVDAELVSGSGNLEMDCLILIPVDDGFAYANGAQIKVSVGSSGIHRWPDDSVMVQHYSSTSVISTGDATMIGGIPPGAAGVLVFAGQENGISVKADQIDVVINYFERWSSLRGSE